MKTPNGRHEIEAAFGRPAGIDGRLATGWLAANIVLVAPPKWRLYYQGDAFAPSSGIRIHRHLKESFLAVMADIWDHARADVKRHRGYDNTTAEYDDLTREWLHEQRLDIHGGGFNFRPITGGRRLSLHAYGIAIDWDPVHNPRGGKDELPEWWYEIWHRHGWTDGRHFKTPDPMHVQFATGA